MTIEKRLICEARRASLLCLLNTTCAIFCAAALVSSIQEQSGFLVAVLALFTLGSICAAFRMASESIRLRCLHDLHVNHRKNFQKF